MYEDNGNDKHYAREYAYTPLSVEQSGSDLTVTIGAREGHYRDMPAERSFKIKILGSVVPEQLTVNGQTVAYEYLGEELAVVIPLPEKSCAKEKVVQIRYPASRTEVNDGLIGQFRRLSKAISALKFRDAGIYECSFGVFPGTLSYTHRTIPSKLSPIASHSYRATTERSRPSLVSGNSRMGRKRIACRYKKSNFV